MRKFLILASIMSLAVYVQAQLSDAEKIVGTWKMDSFNAEGLDEVSKAEIEMYKQFVFFTFEEDSTFTMPDTEVEQGHGGVSKGRYYLSENKIYVLLDTDFPGDFEGAEYLFIRDDYLKMLVEDEFAIYLQKE